MTFPLIATMLAVQGIVERPTWFRMYAMWEGDTTNVKTAKYLITDNLSPAAFLPILIPAVKEITAKVTLP